MKKILFTGKIGSGKTSLLLKKRGFFLTKIFSSGKFSLPLNIIFVDDIGQKSRISRISQEFFSRHPLFRNIKTKNQLKKKLFLGNTFQKNRYWNLLEKILHPQIQEKIIFILKKTEKQKGTIIFECPISEKIFLKKERLNFSKIFLSTSSQSKNFLQLRHFRKISVQEFFEFIKRQNISP